MTTTQRRTDDRTESTTNLEYYMPAMFQQDSEPSRIERFLTKHFYHTGW